MSDRVSQCNSSDQAAFDPVWRSYRSSGVVAAASIPDHQCRANRSENSCAAGPSSLFHPFLHRVRDFINLVGHSVINEGEPCERHF